MWKKIMECWYALWGQSHGGGFGCGCGDYENVDGCPCPPEPKKKIAADGKPLITRDRFENLEKKVKKIEGKVNARNVRNKRGTKKPK